MSPHDSQTAGWDYILDLHRRKISYDNGYWVTMRVTRVVASEGRPHGIKYSLTLHDRNDDRILGYDNSRGIDVAQYLLLAQRRRDGPPRIGVQNDLLRLYSNTVEIREECRA